MFLDNFTSPFTQTLYPEGAPFFTPNGCHDERLKKNLTHINAVFADWDFKPKEGGATGTGKPDFKQFMLDIDDLPTPTYIVESGNGWHLYWMLEESILVDDNNREELIKQVEGVHRFIHNNYGSDSGAMDVLRLMRLPGHEHKKQPEHPFMVKVISEDDTRYTIKELLTAMPPEYKEVVAVAESSETEDYDVKQAAIDAWKQKGAVVSFDTIGRMVWNGQATGTFIGRSGNRNYIATTSEEFPYKGNPVTYVAGVLGISTKQAYMWLIDKYGEPESKVVAVKSSVIECPERDKYLALLAEKKWSDDEWKKKLKNKRTIYLLAFHNYFKQVNPCLLYEMTNDKVYWNYDEVEGIYRELAFSQVRSLVIKLLIDEGLVESANEAFAKTVLNRYRASNDADGVMMDSFSLPAGWIHVKNGWLNLITKELQPHSNSRLSLSKMDTDYETEATCPIYDTFLDVDVQMPSDQVRVIDQFSGYLLTDSIDQHSCLIMEGRKGCGKSMLAEIWMSMLGKKAVPLQLTSLQGGSERFIGSTLANKNLCWFDEANPKTSNINEFFQNLITGELLRIERKGIQGDDFVKNTLKVVLSINEMPDHMPVGMDRRYRHIVFHRSFYEEGIVDPTIKRKILVSEKSGILNRMLRGYSDLTKMGAMTVIGGEEERKREYSLTSDDFSSFLSDHFEPVKDDVSIVRYSYEEMRNSFVAEYPKNYNKQLSVRGFNKKLLTTRLPEFKNTATGKSDTVRGYKGIILKKGHEFASGELAPIRVGIAEW
jgi:P4 family phage/plasmid primase-like protien